MEEGEGTSPQEVGVVIRCHQYRLSLPSPTNVWIEMGVARPGIQATDVLLFVFHTDKDDEPTELVTYTQHKVGEVRRECVCVCACLYVGMDGLILIQAHPIGWLIM